jgi:cysteinyl-tRNA synthetase
MPEALALAWELIKDHSLESKEKISLLLDFDRVFGFGLKSILEMKKGEKDSIPKEIIALAETREQARKNKKWEMADALRLEIENRGYLLKDTDDGFVLNKK